LQKDAEAVDATVLPPEEMPSRPNPVAEEAESVPEYEYPTNGENLGVPPTASANGKRNEPPSLASNYTESEAITESPTPVYNTISDDGEQAPFVKGDKDDDTEVYVGDATWEERTWKELVKLRGGMFWARIGAVH
jgi:hypothetical protein